jgi:hypothetical protein
MGARRFDKLTRVLGAGSSRRQTLAVIGGMVAGAALLAVLPEGATALSKKARRSRLRRKTGVRRAWTDGAPALPTLAGSFWKGPAPILTKQSIRIAYAPATWTAPPGVSA